VIHKDTGASSSELCCFIKVTKNNTKFTPSKSTCDQYSDYIYFYISFSQAITNYQSITAATSIYVILQVATNLSLVNLLIM